MIQTTSHPFPASPPAVPAASRRDPNRRPALAMLSLMVGAIVVVGIARHDPVPRVIDPASVKGEVELRFRDLPDGTIIALDATTGAELKRVIPGQGGFIRVTMRSFASERKDKGFGSAEPFSLTRQTGGQLVLQDRLTGRSMLLNAFGHSNEGVFADLLAGAERARAAAPVNQALLLDTERTTR